MSSPLINIKILLHYVHSSDQCLVLTGSPLQLGEWNPLKGFKGELKEGFYWYFNLSLPKVGTYFECKFVLCRKNEDNAPIEVLRWEACENRRVCFKDLKEKDGYSQQKDFWDFPTFSVYDENQLDSDFMFNFIKNEISEDSLRDILNSRNSSSHLKKLTSLSIENSKKSFWIGVVWIPITLNRIKIKG